MHFIDTHSHLFAEEFDSDRDTVITQAVNSGISKMVLPNIDYSTLNGVYQLCNQYPEHCYPVIGMHPTSVKENYQAELKQIEHFLESNKCVAIGETGIDLYWDKTFFKEQCEAFSEQLNWAYHLKLPIIIHCRDSFDEIYHLLKSRENNLPFGIFHSFGGNAEQAHKVIDLGFKIGINGTVTFKNSKLPEALQSVPLEEIVLETDSPYLTPVPFRGRRNESSYLIYIAQKISEIKGVSVEDVALITTRTAEGIFNFNLQA